MRDPAGVVAARLRAVMSMPTVNGGEVAITQAQAGTWAEAYPGVDVLAELRKARAWLVSNPRQGKTARGMARFCNAWLERAQNACAQGQRRSATGPPPRESLSARVARKNGLAHLFGGGEAAGLSLSGERSDERRATEGTVGGDGGDGPVSMDRGA